MPLTIAQRRHIRLFVASTFIDMHAERDALIKHALPQLRDKSLIAGSAWSEVDLRWGLAPEGGDAGVVAECLLEVGRCRPWVIGILGSRYGWVPTDLPEPLLAEYPWLAAKRGRSVTELEIYHGIIAPWWAGQRVGRVYARDENSASQPRELRRLREEIESAGIAVGRYRDPLDLVRLVVRDVAEQIAANVVDPGHATAGNSSAAVMVAHHAPHYVCRPTVERLLRRAAQRSCVVQTRGESGSGKSALLAHFWQHPPPGGGLRARLFGRRTRYISYFSAIRSTTERCVLHELGGQLGVELPVNVEEARLRFGDAILEHLKASNLVVVLDGLYYCGLVAQRIVSWFPEPWPRGLTVIVSWPGELDMGRHVPVSIVDLPELTASERARIGDSYLARFGKRLPPSHQVQVVEHGATGNPRCLRALLDELRILGSADALTDRLHALQSAIGLSSLYADVVARWDREHAELGGLASRALAFVAASRTGMLESELVQLLGTEGQLLDAQTWGSLLSSLREVLQDAAGRLTIALPELDASFSAPSSESRSCHHILANYFAAQPINPRRVEELPHHLLILQDHEQLARLLTDVRFLGAWWGWDPDGALRVARTLVGLGIGSFLTALSELRPDEVSAEDYCSAMQLLQAGEWKGEALSLALRLSVSAFDGSSKALDDPYGLHEAGLIALQGHRVANARSLLERARDTARTLGRPSIELGAVANLASLYREMMDWELASAAHADEETLAAQLGDHHAGLRGRTNRALLLADRGMLSKSERELRACGRLWVRRGRSELAALAFVHLSRVQRLQGRLRRAQDNWRLALRNAESCGRPASLSMALLEGAQLHAELRDFDAAWQLLARHDAAIHGHDERAPALFVRASILLSLGQATAARRYVVEGLQIVDRAEDPKLAREARRILALCERASPSAAR